MTLTKSNRRLDSVNFIFDSDGEVSDVVVRYSFTVLDDGKPLTAISVGPVSIMALLPPGISKSAANTFGKRVRELVTNGTI